MSIDNRDTTSHRYRVLVIAEAANPEWTSVPLIGWELSRALARIVNVHLVTHIRNREAIVKHGLIEGTDFTAIDNERIASPLNRMAEKLRGGRGKGWTTSTAFSSIAYYSFEREIWRKFRDRIRAGEFDLVHRVTPLSPTSQSLIAKRLWKLDVPFVIGPLNGGVPWPKKFKDRQYREREWLSSLRFLYKLMPGYRSTRKFSAKIIVGSRFTRNDMPRWAREKCVYIAENGVDAAQVKKLTQRVPSLPLQVAFVGRLVAYKGADMLLESAKEFLAARKLDLHVIGDGPERSSLEAMVQDFGIEEAVHFHGWLPHADVLQRLRNCDMFVLPSIREFGGGVVVEAMALGVTPIVADYGGPAELVKQETGIKVAFHDKNSLVENMRQAIELVLRSPSILAKLGNAARNDVVKNLTWDAKAIQIVSVYKFAIGGRCTGKPASD
jgi:glycosyltransferase involved in cell wall biosynthesis